MFRYVLLSAFLCFPVQDVFSQSYFNLSTGTNVLASGASSGFASAYLPSGQFVTIGRTTGDGLELKRFDASGNLMFTKEVNGVPINPWWVFKAHALNDEEIFFSAHATLDSIGGNYYMIAKVNGKTGNAIYSRFISTKKRGRGSNFSLNDEHIIINYPDRYEGKIEKFDIDLESQWYRSIVNDTVLLSRNNTAVDLCMAPDSSVIFLSRADTAVSICRVSPAGDFIFNKIFVLNGFMFPSAVSATADGNFIAAGYFAENAGILYGGWVMEFDLSGNIIWTKLLEGYYVGWIVELAELTNGNIGVFFSTSCCASELPMINGGILLSPLGDALYATYFGDSTASPLDNGFQLFDAEATPYGFLLGGTVFGQNVVIHTDSVFSHICDKQPTSVSSTTFVFDTIMDRTEIESYFSSGPLAPVYPLGTFTSIKDTNPETCLPPVGVSHPGINAGLRLFPNPAQQQGAFNISVGQPSLYSVSMFDASGKQVLTGHFEGRETSIPVTGLNPGLYYVRVQDAAGIPFTAPVLIQ